MLASRAGLVAKMTYRATSRGAMMSKRAMGTVLFSEEHEYVKIDGTIATVGITNYAQQQLGDVVYVSLPGVGDKIEAGDAMGAVESVKAASDVFAPLTGEVVEVNESLSDDPSIVNSDPEGAGWFAKMDVGSEPDLSAFMDANAYKDFCANH